jgi:predicted dehydrogenase
VGFEYDDKAIAWECTCCNDMRRFNGRGRGSIIEGTNGTVLVDRDGYEVYDLKGKKIDEFKVGGETATDDLVGKDSMTDAHFANFIAGIRKGEKLNAPVALGNVAVTMLQMANVAWQVRRDLTINPANCMAVNDVEAMRNWSREYQKGWEPKV